MLVTGAAGGLMGGTGRTLAGMLLQRGTPVRALVRADDDRAAALRAAGAEVCQLPVHAPLSCLPRVATFLFSATRRTFALCMLQRCSMPQLAKSAEPFTNHPD